MKPLALALAAFLGTGCIFVDDDPCIARLSLTWDFERFDGAVTDCAGAEVDWVDVYVDGDFVVSSPCAGGGTVVSRVGAGAHTVTAEGIDVAGRIAYRDTVTASSSACGTRAVALRPAEGTVNLNYASPSCAASPCYLWFSVFDDVANALAAVIASDSPAALKSSFPFPDDVVIRLAAGSYTLDWMQLVSSSFLHVAGTCGPSTFEVAPAAETDLPVTLDPACLP